MENWAQFFVSEKSDEANSLKTDGEPGRTRTCNPLIKSSFIVVTPKKLHPRHLRRIFLKVKDLYPSFPIRLLAWS